MNTQSRADTSNNGTNGGGFGGGRTLLVRFLGRVPYREALELQHELVEARIEDRIPDMLLLLEHPAVITHGKSAVAEHVLAPPHVLEAAGCEVVEVERGGETTYHGPGQLIGYPIIDLRERARNIRRFIYSMEEVFVQLLAAEYGITARRQEEHRGVWVGNDKITALGIAIRRRVTFHGFAFNVNTNLEHFGSIIPCGITVGGQTSLQKLTGRPHDLVTVAERTGRHFAREMNFDPAFEGFQPRA